MQFRSLAILALSGFLFTVGMSASREVEKHGSFVLGSSLDEAKKNARLHGWTFSPFSDYLPSVWSVGGSDYMLTLCDNKVSSIVETLHGDFEEFVAIVGEMQLQWDEPDIQILHIPSGVGPIHTIDVRFSREDSITLVQLQSVNGNRGLTITHTSKMDCTTEENLKERQ